MGRNGETRREQVGGGSHLKYRTRKQNKEFKNSQRRIFTAQIAVFSPSSVEEHCFACRRSQVGTPAFAGKARRDFRLKSPKAADLGAEPSLSPNPYQET